MARTNTYQHFCPIARSLEVIGEKWSLLIVRDLLRGPQRFTDLARALGKITPKWLTMRLRDLEEAGIVTRHQEEGRREVWYRLTPAGEELAPVVGALNVWGLRHAVRPPLEGEAIPSWRLIDSFRGYLVNQRVRPPSPVRWLILFASGESHLLCWDGRLWTAGAADGTPVDVTLRVSVDSWVRLFVAGRETAMLHQLDLAGEPAAVDTFVAALRGALGTPLHGATS